MYYRLHISVLFSTGGYNGGDEAGQRPESSRTKEHFQEVTERLQERLPSCYRRGV